jgi:branched-chain amino acid transport system ATP-binding protein
VREIFSIIERLRSGGATVLLVEQNAMQALRIADRAYVLELGEILLSGTTSLLLTSPKIRQAYLGISS